MRNRGEDSRKRPAFGMAGAGALAAVLLMSGCAGVRTAIPRSPDGACAVISVTVDEKDWYGGGFFGSSPLTSVSWPASGDWKDSVEHWCIHNDEPDGTPDFAMHALVGVESDLGKAADFTLKHRSGEDGAALRHEHGFAFITFRWPLIWMQNIDAGSIGTTAIGRRHGNTIQTFLIRNARQIDTTLLTTDCDTALEIDSGSNFPVETLDFEPGSAWDVIMCRHNKIQNSDYFEAQGSGSGSGFVRDRWYFNVAVDASDQIVVTPEFSGGSVADEAATFLAEVLTIARTQEIYVVPDDCPQPGP